MTMAPEDIDAITHAFHARKRELHDAHRVPLPNGGCGIELAHIERRGFRDVGVTLLARRDSFVLTFRLVQKDRHGRIVVVDVSAFSLEELRDAVDDAIARRDEITRELASLAPPPLDDFPAPTSAPRPLRPERFATDPSTDARSASRASVEGPLFLGDDADEDDAP
jgi:hypothetical protein